MWQARFALILLRRTHVKNGSNFEVLCGIFQGIPIKSKSKEQISTYK
ncbi:hypothetical protein LEP1GSC008_0249 [Leptospira kirschneri serovar Bulgarica str. Nikolaevo]|uniref:Uncharacterized protein n=1 Tax=Leptospira kirschneri serovar Bulgarica str. Nikolaevo TaxID=1240687 RepID=M6F6L7_9LEPT|nr:hypothetical protein LEP1GSC008_0249 [Leptospira kirschneri serovar Bulgarica str. Nikolaevo]